MKTRILSSLVVAGLLVMVAGCGGGKSLSGTDNKLTGQWIAEKLNAKGDRILLVFNEEKINVPATDTSPNNPYDKPATKDPHSIRIVAIRPGGDTYSIDTGLYQVEKSKLVFDLTEMSDFTSPFTITEPKADAPGQMTLGTEVYFKVTGSLDGPQVGGQIQISQTGTDEGVTVSSVKTSSMHQTKFVPGEILVGYHDEASAESPGSDVSSATSALTISSVSSKLSPLLATASVESIAKRGAYHKITIQTSAASKLTALTVASTSQNFSDIAFSRLQTQDQLVEDTAKACAEIEKDPNVKYCVGNAILETASLDAPTDPMFADQWNLDALDAKAAWGAVVPADPAHPPVVAVIDTGIVTHPDLTDKVLLSNGKDFVQASIPGVANLSLDGDGLDNDPTDPGDQQTSLGLPGGSSWHGTHIAGIIAAGIDNATGMAGIAPSVKILPLRAMGFGGNGTLDDVAQAIRYAAKLKNVAECTGWTLSNNEYSDNEGSWTCTIDPARPKANIINLSLGALLDDLDAAPLTEAVNDAAAEGVLVVTAAGNEAKGPGPCQNSAGTTSPNCKFQPAANANAVAVGAVYPNLAFATAYSNFGGEGAANTQFCVAPGGSGAAAILSTVHPSVLGGYAELMGTSQAAAHVSGVAAMILSDKPALTLAQVKQAIAESAVDLGTAGRDKYYGYGLVNAAGALVKARAIAGSPTSLTGALTLSSDNVDFGTMGTTHTVIISGGVGSVSGITATKHVDNGGSAWLGVTLTSGTTPSQLAFTINREGLATGDYTATVTVNSSAGSKPIAIKMKVGTTSTSGGTEIDNLRKEIEGFLSGGGTGYQNETDLGEVIILMIDADSGAAAYYTKTDFTANYNFQFGGINPGKYYILAGVDENLDGTICKEGETEPCFAYPTFAEPELIEVTATTKKNDLVLIY